MPDYGARTDPRGNVEPLKALKQGHDDIMFKFSGNFQPLWVFQSYPT